MQSRVYKHSMGREVFVVVVTVGGGGASGNDLAFGCPRRRLMVLKKG